MAEETLARRPTITASGISGPEAQESRAPALLAVIASYRPAQLP